MSEVVAIRGFGYNRVHLAVVEAADKHQSSWPSPACPFVGVVAPFPALCGVKVRSVQPLAVIMNPGTRPDCRTCIALAPTEEASSDE